MMPIIQKNWEPSQFNSIGTCFFIQENTTKNPAPNRKKPDFFFEPLQIIIITYLFPGSQKTSVSFWMMIILYYQKWWLDFQGIMVSLVVHEPSFGWGSCKWSIKYCPPQALGCSRYPWRRTRALHAPNGTSVKKLQRGGLLMRI